MRYQPQANWEDDRLQARIKELALERRRFGYRRIHRILRREGFDANHKRVYRLYCELGLMSVNGDAENRNRLSESLSCFLPYRITRGLWTL